MVAMAPLSKTPLLLLRFIIYPLRSGSSWGEHDKTLNLICMSLIYHS